MLDMVSWPASIAGRRPSLGWVWRLDRFILPSLAAPRIDPTIADSQAELPTTGAGLESSPTPGSPEAHVHDLYVRYARGLLGYLYHRLPPHSSQWQYLGPLPANDDGLIYGPSSTGGGVLWTYGGSGGGLFGSELSGVAGGSGGSPGVLYSATYPA
jgi:hypothetical protein